MSIPKQFNVVVLPEPVPPAITKFAGLLSNPSIQTHIIAARRTFTVPNLIKSIIVRGSSRNLRIVRVGPSGETDVLYHLHGFHLVVYHRKLEPFLGHLRVE